jgi:hypothetical protein
MDTKNTYLITQPIFGVKKNEQGKKIVHHNSIINYGEDLGNGQVKYLTKAGVQVSSVFNFDSSIALVKFESICLDSLMSNWKRINKTYKPVVLDESINTHEVFENDFSPLKIMVERREDCIAIKPIFDSL